MRDHQRETIARALDTWGEQQQLMMFAGETGEALAHLGRFVQGRFDPVAFGSEVADVLVMCEAAKLIAERRHGRPFVDAEVTRKVARLAAKLDALTPDTPTDD